MKASEFVVNLVNGDITHKSVTLGDYNKDSRGSGKTTLIALGALYSALSLPGERVYLTDHVDSKVTNERLMVLCAKLSDKLGLKGLRVGRNGSQPYIVFTPFVPLETVIDDYKNKA